MSTDRQEARPAETLAEAMIELSVQVQPMHDWLTGQVAYFAAQGFTPQECLAMAACEFVSVFGTAIPRELPPGWGDDV